MRSKGVRRQVLTDGRTTLHHSQRADTHELMHQAIAGNKRVISNLYVAGDERPIGKSVMVAHRTVVANVAMGHEKIPRPDDGVFIRSVGPVNGDVLPENVFVTDAQLSGHPIVLQILRGTSDYRSSMDLVAPAKGRLAGQMNVRTNVTIRANGHPRVDDGIWTDPNGLVQPGP